MGLPQDEKMKTNQYGKITTLQTLPYEPKKDTNNSKPSSSKPAASDFLRLLIEKNEQDRSKIETIDDFAKVVQMKTQKD